MKEYIVAVEDDVIAYEEYSVGYIRRQKKLIRCKDCKFYGVCVLSNAEDGFCAWAEPKVKE
jgi:hypothetical protein